MAIGLLDGLFNGISIGAVLLIAALGLAIIFGLMGVINMAHGELMMLGAYTTFVVQNVFKGIGGFAFETYILFAIPLAFLVAALVGLILERGVIRYLYGRPLETLLATWGVSLILQQFVRSVSWVLVIGIAVFCLLFFGGLRVLKQRPDFDRIRSKIIAIILPLSLGISWAVSAFLGQTYQLSVTKPWFGAQNVDVTAPAWLRGGIPAGQFPIALRQTFYYCADRNLFGGNLPIFAAFCVGTSHSRCDAKSQHERVFGHSYRTSRRADFCFGFGAGRRRWVRD